MIRRARLLVLGAVAAVLLTGCGVEPGRAGAAAIVGGTRIPVAEVQSWMREAFAQDPDLEQRLQQQGRLDDSAREIAGHLVKQELVEQVAQREGLRVSPGRVEEVIDRHGGVEEITRGSLLTPQQARSMARSNAWRTTGFDASGRSIFWAGLPTPATLPVLKVRPW